MQSYPHADLYQLPPILTTDDHRNGIPNGNWNNNNNSSKRPDGLTLIPWHGGRSSVWNVIVVSLLAAFYVDRAADMAATRKTEKYPIFSIQVRAYSSKKSWLEWELPVWDGRKWKCRNLFLVISNPNLKLNLDVLTSGSTIA